jgi:hypothetical protein
MRQDFGRYQQLGTVSTEQKVVDVPFGFFRHQLAPLQQSRRMSCYHTITIPGNHYYLAYNRYPAVGDIQKSQILECENKSYEVPIIIYIAMRLDSIHDVDHHKPLPTSLFIQLYLCNIP